jgi:ABC-type nitrate/sulfonate/bicarbonate transport system substrate-binding protein
VVLDIRRGDGPKAAFDYTMSAIATTDELIRRSPEAAAGAVRAIVKTHKELKADPERATEVGRKLFPPEQAALIADLVRRDLPYYDAAISPNFVAGMNRFSRDIGILDHDVPYGEVVAEEFAPLWRA